MPDEPQNIAGNQMPTEGFQVAYANLASLTVNYNDLRIYFADAQAKVVAAMVAPGTHLPIPEPQITPRICMVLTPEFAKSLLDALASSIAVYEKQFGPLRPAPQIPTQAATPKPASR